MEGGGDDALASANTFAPYDKEPFIRSTQSQLFRENEVFLQSARKQSSICPHEQDTLSILLYIGQQLSPDSYYSSRFILICSLAPASSCTHFFLSRFTLSLSSCYLTTLAAIHKMAAGSWELERTEWKPFSNRSRTRHRESPDFHCEQD